MSDDPRSGNLDAMRGIPPQHTPGPWRFERVEGCYKDETYTDIASLCHGHGRTILKPALESDSQGRLFLKLTSCNEYSSGGGDELERAHNRDLDFLLRACNSHDDLLAACEWASNELKRLGRYPHELISAIAKAKGETQ